MAAAALIVSILSALGVLWIGSQQVRLGREQVALTRRQTEMDAQRELDRTSPAISLTPRSISSIEGGYDYAVEVANNNDIAGRDVQIKAYLHGTVVAATGVANVPRVSVGERVLTIPFAGSSDELGRLVSFVATDRDGREWRYDA